MKLAVLLLALSGCSIPQGVEARIPVRMPDGSTEIAEFHRAGSEGPVEVTFTYEPTTGRWTVEWKSNVSLDAWSKVSLAKLEAQARVTEQASSLLLRAVGLLAGVPIGPAEPEPQQGKGP